MLIALNLQKYLGVEELGLEQEVPALPFQVLARSPELQARLIERLKDAWAEAEDIAENIPDARELLPELAFLSDAALYELIDDWSSDYMCMSWDYGLNNRGTTFGYYIFMYLEHGKTYDLKKSPLWGLDRSAMAAAGKKLVHKYAAELK
ncbi:hypothetical protein [Quatrionicoccus australiensis]|uniref:hypothetical protein n=1 Tax=Quatrionicoccus australiensis TaxID=138118 RepID=UPI001CFA3F72|nr:hypothetical protein [Quatrionicoccus australiensis]MCB4359596.1 hypothetical protein [Quatrionicoccus australiensis]